MGLDRVERCIEALKDDCARQSGNLSAYDAARVIDRRKLNADEAAEVWRQLEDLGLLAVTSEANAERTEASAPEASGANDAHDVDLLSLFVGDVRNEAALSDPEVVQLAHLIRVGTQAEAKTNSSSATESHLTSVIEAGRVARDRFVRANVRLVFFFAKEYFGTQGASKLDIIQDGIIGLMRAVDLYEPSRGFRFATYAVWWIRQRILLGIAGRDGVIQMPLKLAGKLRRMTMKRAQFTRENGRAPGLLELATEMEIEPGELRFLQQVAITSVSLEEAVPGADGLKVGEALTDATSPSPEERFAQEELVSAIQRNLELLSPRDCAIVQRRFGLVDGEEATLQEIADEFSLTRERVRQIVDQAVARFRRSPAWRTLL